MKTTPPSPVSPPSAGFLLGNSASPVVTTETQIHLLISGYHALQREIDDNKEEAEQAIAKANSKLSALEDERNQALKWGVISLGAAVIGMGVWIFEKLAAVAIR